MLVSTQHLERLSDLELGVSAGQQSFPYNLRIPNRDDSPRRKHVGKVRLGSASEGKFVHGDIVNDHQNIRRQNALQFTRGKRRRKRGRRPRGPKEMDFESDGAER